MPIYAYECDKCKNYIEINTSIKDYVSSAACSCGGVSRRVWNTVAIHPNMYLSQRKHRDGVDMGVERIRKAKRENKL